jgi:dolichol kinase
MPPFERTIAKTISLRPRHDLHLLRKAWHIGTGSLGLYIYHALDITPFAMGIGLLVFAMAGFLLDILRLRIDELNQVALNVLGPFMRECERRRISGLPFYALGVGLALLLFEERLAVLAICFLVFSEDKILPNKSLQGAVAGFAVCYLLTFVYGIYFGVNEFELIYFACFAGLIGMIGELVSAFGIDDNLSIPVLSGFGLTLLNLFIPLF